LGTVGDGVCFHYVIYDSSKQRSVGFLSTNQRWSTFSISLPICGWWFIEDVAAWD
jgi:hypothetical protein